MKTHPTRVLFVAIPLVVAALAFASRVQSPIPVHPDHTDNHGRTTLPGGWRLTPAERLISIPGDMPAGIPLPAPVHSGILTR